MQKQARVVAALDDLLLGLCLPHGGHLIKAKGWSDREDSRSEVFSRQIRIRASMGDEFESLALIGGRLVTVR
ncbi:MAG: hypothetical protein WBL50_06670 [Candidatus Acidiferrum sp.]